MPDILLDVLEYLRKNKHVFCWRNNNKDIINISEIVLKCISG
jgi:hypothetical protein